MKKIVVCGDSFCASSKHNRHHFSQILEDEYGYVVTILARGSASNTNVCFQIQEAIKMSPDIVVYSRPESARLDISVANKPFDLKLGLKNFIHVNADETSHDSPLSGDLTAPFYSSGIGSLLSMVPAPFYKKQISLSDNQLEAVRMYMTFIYDRNLKDETDRWASEYWEYQLTQNNIVSILFNTVGHVAYEFAKNTPRYPAIYHTDPATQSIVANHIHQEIQKKGCNLQ